MRAPIQARKHYVQQSLATVTAATTLNIVIASGVSATTENLATEVREGSVLKAVYIEAWLRGQDTSPGSVLATISKNPDGTTPTFADLTALNGWSNKKNVLYHTQGLTNINTDSATPFIRGWFKIPKGKQRMGLGDRIILSVSAQALDTNVCGFATYKEYA